MRLEHTDPLAAFLLRSPLGALVRGVAHLRASVRSKLLAAFLLVTLLFLLMGAFSVQTIRRMSQHTDQLDVAHQRVAWSHQLQHSLAMQMHLTGMALLVRDEATLANILRENNRFNDTLVRIEQAAPEAERSDHPEDPVRPGGGDDGGRRHRQPGARRQGRRRAEPAAHAARTRSTARSTSRCRAHRGQGERGHASRSGPACDAANRRSLMAMGTLAVGLRPARPHRGLRHLVGVHPAGAGRPRVPERRGRRPLRRHRAGARTATSSARWPRG